MRLINRSQIKTKLNQSEDQILPSVVHFPIRVHFEPNDPKLKTLGTQIQFFLYTLSWKLAGQNHLSAYHSCLINGKQERQPGGSQASWELRAVVVFRLVIIHISSDWSEQSKQRARVSAGRLGGRLIFLKTRARDNLCSAPKEWGRKVQMHFCNSR